MSIKILIADDHRLFRESLSSLFIDPTIEIVGLAENGKEAIEYSRTTKPDIILMDIGMNGMNGIEATAAIKRENPEIKILGLSMHTEVSFVKGILEAGASGYLIKNCSYGQLVEAIYAVNKGNKYLSEEITNIVLNDYLSNDTLPVNHLCGLTEREIEVFDLCVIGFSTREIAEKLFVSVKTVSTHKQHILKKLDLKSSSDLIKYGIKNGLIPSK
jgi:DNA-binding NarL/FixJ family response regulator